MPLWTYPIRASTSTTISPSRVMVKFSGSLRAGCCGPNGMVKVFWVMAGFHA